MRWRWLLPAAAVELENLRVTEVNDLMEELVAGGATVAFYVNHDPHGATRKGTAKTGALMQQAIGNGETVLRVPDTQVFSLASMPEPIRAIGQRHGCDAHAVLALGVVNEKRSPKSRLYNWLRLLPRSFANVLYFDDAKTELVKGTYFSYITEAWPRDLQCMSQCVAALPDETWGMHTMLGRPREQELRWALSVVKTRAFAVREDRESTLLIPAADFINHNRLPNVRQNLMDPAHFVAARNLSANEEVYLEYAKASNLEFLIRYGFSVPGNVYGGRQFDLTGEPLQLECPSIMLRHDLPAVVEDMTVDCHRQARYMSWSEQFGALDDPARLREDLFIYRALAEACAELARMLDVPEQLRRALLEQSERDRYDTTARELVAEVAREEELLLRCVTEYTRLAAAKERRPLNPAMTPEYVRMLKTYRTMGA